MDSTPDHQPKRTPSGAGVTVLLLALVGLAGCAPSDRSDVPVACVAFALPDAPANEPAVEPGASDTLELVVVFDSLPDRSGGLRLRVDGLAEAGMITFAAPRPGSAAAGMTLAVPARYHGCAAMAPHGLQLNATHPPRGKAWVRVTTDRPVRLLVATGGGTVASAVTMPGASALVRWSGE